MGIRSRTVKPREHANPTEKATFEIGTESLVADADNSGSARRGYTWKVG